MGKSAISSRLLNNSTPTGDMNSNTHSTRPPRRPSNSKPMPGLDIQPRKFETADTLALHDEKNRDNNISVDPGVYNNNQSTNRKELSPINFMFNTARQDLIGTLLNNYSTTNPNSMTQSNFVPNKNGSQMQSSQQKSQLIDSNFTNYYMNNKEQSLGNLGPDIGRQKGDSIFLPLPINSQARTGSNDYDINASSFAGSNNSIGLPSRSNSIFSSLIQIPGSNGNSISGPSSGNYNKRNSLSAGGMNNYPKGRQLSLIPSLSGQDQISLEDLENILNKESLGNLLAWQQQQNQYIQQGQQNPLTSGDPKNLLIKPKPENVDFSGWDNIALPGSISGFSSSLGDILAGISNGSIDLSNMNNEQRRDSILKFINDQQNFKDTRTTSYSSTNTKLREDIFEKPKQVYLDEQKNGKDSLPHSTNKNRMSIPSSTSSKVSSKYPDEPQSPKTSPTNFHTRLNEHQEIDPMGQPPNIQLHNHNVHPTQVQNGQVAPDHSPAHAPEKLFNTQNPQFQYADYSQPQSNNMNTNNVGRNIPQFTQPVQNYPQTQQYLPNNYGAEASSGTIPKTLVTPQNYVKTDDGRPLLGATKIDQLMLVIQARDKGVTNKIPQAPDGSILASPDKGGNGILPQPADLVGGVEKPVRPKQEDSSDEEDSDLEKKKRRKAKNQQCPFCFKCFTQTTHLEVHVRSHIGYKPYECSYCHKRFTQGGNLRTHLRLHTGEKPFVCEICKRSFSRKGNLAAHKLTHENLKPYRCKLDGCDKSFTQLGNLKSHQNRFHLETLNELMRKLAELSGPELENLPQDEKDLLDYFKELYKNSNKGIRGRGKRIESNGQKSSSPQ